MGHYGGNDLSALSLLTVLLLTHFADIQVPIHFLCTSVYDNNPFSSLLRVHSWSPTLISMLVAEYRKDFSHGLCPSYQHCLVSKKLHIVLFILQSFIKTILFTTRCCHFEMTELPSDLYFHESPLVEVFWNVSCFVKNC